MTKEMRVLLNSLVNASKAQRRQLGLQIEDMETLLREAGERWQWVDIGGSLDAKDAMDQSDFENNPDVVLEED